MYPSRNVDKVWEVATMLAHRDMRVTPANTLSTTAAAAAGAAARCNVNGTCLTLVVVQWCSNGLWSMCKAQGPTCLSGPLGLN